MMTAALSHRFGSVDGRLSGRVTQGSIISPNSSNTTPAFRHGAPTLDVSDMPLSGEQTLTSPVDIDGLQPEIHICPQCQKQFGRLCDLNKHSKSHSRPFKCAFQNCKYFQLGWPTAKELERHVNDKHSAAPQTYPCLYQDCSYMSKRESNCKQHMEKAHGWRYVRTKSSGRRSFPGVASQLSSLQTFFPTHTAATLHPSPNSSKPPSRQHKDFVLFPPGRDHSITADSDDEYDDDGFMDLDDRNSQDSDVVIPWTSPGTRLRRRETFLEKFTQKFNPATAQNEDLLIDPQLSSVGDFNTLTTSNNTGNSFKTSTVSRDAATSTGHVSSTNGHAVYPNTQFMPQPHFTVALQQRPVGSVAPSQHGGSSSANLSYSTVGRPIQETRSQIPTRSKRKEEDDDDDHPQKKFKLSPSPRTDFKENQMPDIFVTAYPEVYNRNTRSLYQSCETEHKDISTLVRHLSRAPHRLDVSEKWISSFDTSPQELSHAKIGVCRRCWETFTSREAFDLHITPTSAECEKRSKGKREKWQIIYDAFTPLAVDIKTPELQNTTRPAMTLPVPDGQPSTGSAHGVGSSANDDDSPIPPPSPTTIDLGPHIPMELEGDDEIEKLRQENRQLKGIIRDVAHVILRHEVVDLSRLSQQLPAALLRAIAVPATGQPGRLTFSGDAHLEEDTPDRESLVGHMNSQPTDVDRQGMIQDMQTLSRTSSGISSDRSTIRHVSNSPPQRFEQYPGNDPSGRRPGPGNTGDSQLGRHQPTSLPDSGYGSDKKKDSLFGGEAADQPKQAGMPLTQDHVAIPEHGKPCPRSHVAEPGQQTGDPVHSSPDPMLPSSGMSPDPFVDFGQMPDLNAYYIDDIVDQFGEFSQQSSSSYQA